VVRKPETKKTKKAKKKKKEKKERGGGKRALRFHTGLREVWDGQVGLNVQVAKS